MEINIADIPEDKEIEDYPDDTVFVWSEGNPPKIDPNTGEVLGYEE